MTIWKHGAAAYMVSRRKNNVTVVKNITQEINVEALATKIAQTVAETISKNLLDKMGKIPYSPNGSIDVQKEVAIAIDESIIPMTVQAIAEHTNLDNMGTEQITEEKGLADTKARLANLLKKKG